jgi:hypothetical protein
MGDMADFAIDQAMNEDDYRYDHPDEFEEEESDEESDEDEGELVDEAPR